MKRRKIGHAHGHGHGHEKKIEKEKNLTTETRNHRDKRDVFFRARVRARSLLPSSLPFLFNARFDIVSAL